MTKAGVGETSRAVEEDSKDWFSNKGQVFSILVGLMLTLLLVALDQTILTTATPKIVASLNGFERYAWISTAYLLSSTVAVPIFGKLSDFYGRKLLFLIGISLFVLASALCGIAGMLPLPIDGMNQLILCRALQGIASGIITSIVFIMIGDIFPPAVRGKYQGLFGSVWLLAALIGPVVGGWLSESLSWRWVFYINIPVGIIAGTFIYVAFPSLKQSQNKHNIDYIGIITLTIGLVSLMLSLTWIPSKGILDISVIATLIIAIAMVFMFIVNEKRADEPIIPLKIFSNRIVVISAVSIIFTSVGAYGIIFYLPLYMQQVLGMSAAASGAALTPAMIMLIIGNIGGGILVAQSGRYKWITIAGLVFMALGAALVIGVSPSTTVAVVVASLICIAIGLGITTPIYTIVSQNAVPYSELAVITAFAQFIRQIGVTLGVSLAGALILGGYHNTLAHSVPDGTPATTMALFQDPLQLQQAIAQLQTQVAQADQVKILVELANNAFSHAIDLAFLLCAIILAAMVVLNIFLQEIPLRKANTTTPAPVENPTATSA